LKASRPFSGALEHHSAPVGGVADRLSSPSDREMTIVISNELAAIKHVKLAIL